MYTRRVVSLAIGMVLLLMASPAHAQLSVGGNVGWLFDTREDRLALGADARIALQDKRWVINPRYTHYLLDEGSSRWQLDGNLLYKFPVIASEAILPYAGIGIGLISSTFETGNDKSTETDIGTNLISGFEFKTISRIKPWLHFQYTAVPDQRNTFAGFFGLSYVLQP